MVIANAVHPSSAGNEECTSVGTHYTEAEGAVCSVRGGREQKITRENYDSMD